MIFTVDFDDPNNELDSYTVLDDCIKIGPNKYYSEKDLTEVQLMVQSTCLDCRPEIFTIKI